MCIGCKAASLSFLYCPIQINASIGWLVVDNSTHKEQGGLHSACFVNGEQNSRAQLAFSSTLQSLLLWCVRSARKKSSIAGSTLCCFRRTRVCLLVGNSTHIGGKRQRRFAGLALTQATALFFSLQSAVLQWSWAVALLAFYSPLSNTVVFLNFGIDFLEVFALDYRLKSSTLIHWNSVDILSSKSLDESVDNFCANQRNLSGLIPLSVRKKFRRRARQSLEFIAPFMTSLYMWV